MPKSEVEICEKCGKPIKSQTHANTQGTKKLVAKTIITWAIILALLFIILVAYMGFVFSRWDTGNTEVGDPWNLMGDPIKKAGNPCKLAGDPTKKVGDPANGAF